MAELSLLSENVVVDIDEGGTSLGGKVAVELGFSFNNTFETAKSFEVGAAYIGDEAEVGIGDFTEGIDFTGVVGSHFDDGNLGVGKEFVRHLEHEHHTRPDIKHTFISGIAEIFRKLLSVIQQNFLPGQNRIPHHIGNTKRCVLMVP